MYRILLAATLALGLAGSPAGGAERNPVAARSAGGPLVDRVLIRLRAADLAGETLALPGEPARPVAARVAALGLRSGISLHLSRSVTADLHVARLLIATSGARLERTLAALRADPAVEYADPDRRRYAHAGTAPNDPLFLPTPGVAAGQWYLGAPAVTDSGTTLAAINAVGAWDTTTGVSGVVIADLDTGVRFDHPDLGRAASGGKLLPGYDFVGPDGGAGGTAFLAANDGDGWDADPSDPGDWISTVDTNHAVFSECMTANSSWHGTRTAGILGALTNNDVGVAGIAWNSWILPVRVLGKCGGYDSDILAAMLWSAGIPVSGAPSNPYPAHIINMSLGSTGTCPATAGSYQDVIRQVTNAGAVVVISAGNDGGAVDEPADCPGAIAVTGVRHIGTKVGYANLGPSITLAAPAGNCVTTSGTCLFSIDTTTNFGTTVPGTNGYTDEFNINIGTSFSAPIVSGIVALMLSTNGNLTPAELIARLKTAARPFPVVATDESGAPIPMCAVPAAGATEAFECNCTTSTCGAGLADAANAVHEAARPIAAIAVTGSAAAGQTVTLSGAGSAASCQHTIASYTWSILPDSTAGGPPALSALTGASTSVVSPASGTVDVELTITDEDGRIDTATVSIAAGHATTTAPLEAGTTACLAAIAPPATPVSPGPPTQPAGGGGGGGALDPLTLSAFLAIGALARRWRRDRPARCHASG